MRTCACGGRGELGHGVTWCGGVGLGAERCASVATLVPLRTPPVALPPPGRLSPARGRARARNAPSEPKIRDFAPMRDETTATGSGLQVALCTESVLAPLM